MAGILQRLGRFCVRHRRWVLVTWALVATGTGILGAVHGGTFVQQDRLPGTETQRSVDLLRQDFPQITGPTTTIVFHPQRGVSLSDWRVSLLVGKAIDQVGRLPRVATVENPYGHTGGAKGPDTVVAVAHFRGTARDLRPKDMNALQAKAAANALAKAQVIAQQMAQGLNVKLAGLIYASNQAPESPVRPMPMMAMRAGAFSKDSVQPLAINPRQIDESATVYAVFAIQ